ncbi:hypothetical protein ABT142_18935 [Streptomyces sp. NPDC001857]|uniref:hypothetical protein n=1 Tax=unclassified Streptomyces TaxID=2593676 RepID=UPI00332B2316
MGTSITAVVALVGVLLGGWLSLRNQDRQWRRDHARQWRDIRLAAYRDFVVAARAYATYAADPSAGITAVPHPRIADTFMPVFDAAGRPYAERLDASSTTVRLVSESPQTIRAAEAVVRAVRQIAAARAAHTGSPQLPVETFVALWSSLQAFLPAARQELGLIGTPPDAYSVHQPPGER